MKPKSTGACFGGFNSWTWSLAALVGGIAAVRACLLFSTPLVPGMNGAYYLVQARSILTRGSLGIPDLPLVFYLQAAIAWAVQACSGLPQEQSILFAVKLADALLPAMLAIPVALLALRWTRACGASAWLALGAAAAASLNPSVLRMVGDFQKNSLGLVWLAALLYCLDLWMEAPSRRRMVAVLAFGGLAGLTHIGVFGAALLFGGISLLTYCTCRRFQWRHFGPLFLAAAGVALIAAGVVLWRFDPSRIERLAHALRHPAHFLGMDHEDGGMGGPGGPGVRWVSFAFCGIAALPALAVAGRQWARKIPSAPWNVPVGCALGVLALTGPWAVHGDKFERLQLLAMVPAVLAAFYAVIHDPHPRLRHGLAGALVVLMTCSGLGLLAHPRSAVITPEALDELHGLAPLFQNSEKTLICARHGLEWWTAWALHTHIAQSSALRPADWQNFEAVYFLKSQGRGEHAGPPPGGMGGPRSGLLGLISFSRPGPPPSGQGPQNGSPDHRQARHGHLGDGPPPPPGMEDAEPGGWQRHHGPGGPDGKSGNPMEAPEFPSDAERVHQGANFSLARVNAAPEFVRTQAAEK